MFELSLRCPQDQVEAACDALEALEAQSISVEDADALTDAEQPLFGEPGMAPVHIGWQHSHIKALFTTEAQALAAARLLEVQDFFADCQWVGIAAVAEQDWVRLTQSQFAPVSISPGFWIVPSWHEPPSGARHIIRLDPGLAFGTGTHPTTSMCLRWIALGRDTRTLGRVLDYGCGSGILAIVAGKLGAGEITATDTDPQALLTTVANAAGNGVVVDVAAPDSLPPGTFDLVLANILAGPLIELEPLLAARTRAGGRIVLSGILESQAAEVVAAYARDFDAAVLATEEGWALVGGGRR